MVMNWPHAPMHKLNDGAAVIVTAATLNKEHLLTSEIKLDRMQELLFDFTRGCGWNLQSWSVLVNHYHFVANPTRRAAPLGQMLGELHSKSAKEINAIDGTPGRKVWYQFWDTDLTYQRSYLARLNYVQQNPVKHGLVVSAEDYRWCSARWMLESSGRAFYKTVSSFKIDRVNVIDDFL